MERINENQFNTDADVLTKLNEIVDWINAQEKEEK
jgi:hypothetical protein